jgi:hypothetical protein
LPNPVRLAEPGEAIAEAVAHGYLSRGPFT